MIMADALTVVSLLPFGIHVLAGVASWYNCGNMDAKMDTAEWWMQTCTNCVSIAPISGTLQPIFAMLHTLLAIAAGLFHFAGSVNVRRMAAKILFGFFIVTMARHVLNYDWPEVIGYLYMNIAVFVVLVFSTERLERKSRSL